MSETEEKMTIPDDAVVQEAMPQAGEMVSHALNLPVRRVTPLVGMGSVNLIYFVETIGMDGGSGPEIVARLNTPDDDAATVREQYEKEWWCIAQAASVGVPGPITLAAGEHGGRAFMLQERLPGVNGKSSALPRPDIWRELGRFARHIHAIPVSGFGDTPERIAGDDAEEGWRRFLEYNLGALTDSDPLLGLGVYRPEQQNAIRETFQWLRSLPLRVGLNHGDLAPRNVMVDESGQISLLDWGCAEINVVPHYDLTQCLEWYNPAATSIAAFLEGYGMTSDVWNALLPELRAFALLKAFDLTRWAIDRCPARIEEISARARVAVERFLPSPRDFARIHTPA